MQKATALVVTPRFALVRQAASRHLKQLVQIGVLKEKTIGREKLFIHPKWEQ